MLGRLFRRKPRGRISIPALEQALSETANRMPNLHWAVIVSVDGLVLKMYDPFGNVEQDRAAAMTAAALSLGERISHELGHGSLTYAVTAGEQRLFIAYPIAEAYVLAISLPAEAEVDAAIDTLAQVRSGFASALCPGAG